VPFLGICDFFSFECTFSGVEGVGGVSGPFTTESKVLSALEREHKLEFELEFEAWGAGMEFGCDEGVFRSLILDERRRPELEFFWSSPIS
jgi:hypothetical protein